MKQEPGTITPTGQGRPDYSSPYPLGQYVKPGDAEIYSLTDAGELAARLGSIVTHDRRGDVMWLDDFESEIEKWVGGGSGLLHGQSWSALYSRNGGFSYKHTCGSTLELSSRQHKILPYPVLSRVGFMFSFSIPSFITEVWFSLQLYDAPNSTLYEIQYDVATQTFTYLDSLLVYQALTPTKLIDSDLTLFHTFKMVADLTQGKYVRLIANDQKYDLTDIDGYVRAGAVSDYLVAGITFIGTNALNGIAYVDDAILTQNEPINPVTA